MEYGQIERECFSNDLGSLYPIRFSLTSTIDPEIDPEDEELPGATARLDSIKPLFSAANSFKQKAIARFTRQKPSSTTILPLHQ